MNANLHSPEHMLQIEYIKHPQDYDMGSFHYHNAYELLFLQEGEYTLITMDTAYTICKNQVSLIPPCCMHKSLGRAGNERTLMYFDDRFLNRYFTEKSRSLLFILLPERTAPFISRSLLRSPCPPFSNP